MRRIPTHLALLGMAVLVLVPMSFLESGPGYSLVETADSPLDVTFSLPSGTYNQNIEVALSTPHSDATILFTRDGSEPTPENGTVYTGPLHLSSDPESAVAIRATATLPGGETGPIASATYFLGVQTALPLVSLLVDPDDLWHQENGIFVRPTQRGIAWERPAQVTFLEPDGSLGFQVSAGVRVHGQRSRTDEKKSLRLYFRREYGTPWLEYPLFPDSELTAFKRLVLHAGGQDYPLVSANGTLLRSQLVAGLINTTQIDGYATHSRPVVLFINGQLWGVYNLRERVDRRFLAGHYGVASADLLGGAVRNQVPLEGDRRHWQNLTEFVETHDLRQPAHYAYVQTQIDLDNFIDYNILQMYMANTDWPHNNQEKFRHRSQGGRWHWLFWDLDFGFGLAPRGDAPRGNVTFDMVQWVFESDNEAIQRSTLLLRRLMENPDFRAVFLARTAELLNTALLPTHVIEQIDVLAAELEPGMAYEQQRWPGSGDWQASIDYLRDFARRRPGYVRQHIVDGFELDGAVQLTFAPPPDNGGFVAVNGNHHQELPWQGIYFQNTAVGVTAVPEPGYRFAGWEPPDLPQTPTITLTASVTQTIRPRFVPTSPESPGAGDVDLVNYGVDGEDHQVWGPMAGDWIELVVRRPGGVDLRGWRLTDNDTKTKVDEGSLIFGQDAAFANVPQGTSILVIATETAVNDERFPRDDLDSRDGRTAVYVGNGNLDTQTDPWFNLASDDNLVLLAPGASTAFADDRGIAFLSVGPARTSAEAVTPASFGVLEDGVTGN